MMKKCLFVALFIFLGGLAHGDALDYRPMDIWTTTANTTTASGILLRGTTLTADAFLVTIDHSADWTFNVRIYDQANTATAYGYLSWYETNTEQPLFLPYAYFRNGLYVYNYNGTASVNVGVQRLKKWR